MHGKCMKRLETNLLPMQEACILLLSVRGACAPKLVHAFNICMMQMVACIWYMDTMQSAADSIRHCFLATTGYDNNKGQVLASVYYHYNLSCS